MKRDDQILPLRLLQEERRHRLTTQAKDKDRARAQMANGDQTTDVDMTMDVDETGGLDEMAGGTADQDATGTRVIVIHPGSQNLRIGLASDAIPKTVPMVIARRWTCSESEEGGREPSPKRIQLDDGSFAEPEKMFGPEVCCKVICTH